MHSFLSVHLFLVLFLVLYLVATLALSGWTAHLMRTWARCPYGLLPILADNHFWAGDPYERDYPTRGAAFSRYIIGFIPALNVFLLTFCVLRLLLQVCFSVELPQALSNYFKQPLDL